MKPKKQVTPKTRPRRTQGRSSTRATVRSIGPSPSDFGSGSLPDSVLGSTKHTSSVGAPIDPREPPRDRAGDQLGVLCLSQELDDRPEVLFGGYPADRIATRERQRTWARTEGTIAGPV